MDYKSAAHGLVRFLLWILTTVIAFYAFFLGREFMWIALEALGLKHWTINAIDKFVLFGIGITLMAFIVYSEHLYRQNTYRTFVLLVAIETLVISAIHLLRLLIINSQTAFSVIHWTDIVFLGLSFLVGIFLYRLHTKIPRIKTKNSH